MSRPDRLRRELARPISGDSLAFFRIAFGLTLVWEVFRYWSKGWIEKYWLEPTFHFPYENFEWVTPWPGVGMKVHFAVLGLAALAVALGALYRVAAPLLFLAITYVFLLEEAQYLNHIYLVCLLAFLVACLPLQRYGLSLARRRTDRAPSWQLFLLRFQIAVPYVFGGIAKLNHDWLRGEPIRDWLRERDDIALIGPLFHEESVVYLFAYGGLLIDLLCVPFLLWRRTAPWAFGLVASFHLLNSRLFNIGIFPWVMLAATTLFLPPSWPSQLRTDFGRRRTVRGLYVAMGGLGGAIAVIANERFEIVPTAVGVLAGAVLVFTARRARGDQGSVSAHEVKTPFRRLSRPITFALGVWIATQTLLPLRHFVIPGVVHWTEEGHRFAWHMKLRDKSGGVGFQLRNPETGEEEFVHPRPELTPRQYRKMSTRPYMIKQYAEHLAEQKRAEGWSAVEVRAVGHVSLNGRKPRALIDPEVDLISAESHWLRHQEWILQIDAPEPDEGPRPEPRVVP